MPAPPCAWVLAVAVNRSSPSPSHATTPRNSGMPARTTGHTTVAGDCWLQPELAISGAPPLSVSTIAPAASSPISTALASPAAAV